MQGNVHADFGEVATAFRRQIERTSGGAALSVYHRGEQVVDLWGGNRIDASDDEGPQPWRHDTVAMCFSTTKGVASTAVHVLADRGQIDYDEPVATYWPEFAQNGKAGVTVRHVLTHSAGLHRMRSLVDGDAMLDWQQMCEALAAARPAYEPGTRHGYHALTYGWLVGELVRRVSGRTISDFVRTELAEPLGLDGLSIGLPPEERGRVAPLVPMGLPRPTWGPLKRLDKEVGRRMGQVVSALPGPLNTRRLANALAPRGVEDVLLGTAVMDAEVPAANGFFSARSLGAMYAMLAGGGQLGGVRILSPETVEAAGTVHGHGLDLVLVIPMDWRLGYHRVFTTRGPIGSAFGHFGFGGSGGWADPERDLAVAYVCNRGSGTPIGDRRIAEVSHEAKRCADRRY